jgi:predicted lipid-binding transport protein (Tim44 family)
MGDGFQFLDIVLFAMVAAFLVLRLRSVLGRKTGHEQRRADPMSQRTAEREAEGKVVELPTRNGGQREAEEPAIDPSDPMAAGLTRIRIADNSFNPKEFAQGARAAFEMIVQAFAAGDTAALKTLLAPEVFENFSEAIRERETAKQTLETTIVGLKSADIVEADMDGDDAVVTVKFVSEQVNVTRDAEGRVVEGDPNQVTDITDIWSFRRNTRSRDPNWKLDETRSQN